MKTRYGFVSNSSTSSFVLAFKGELTQERLLNLFGVTKDSFLYSFAQEVAKFLFECHKHHIRDVAELRDEYSDYDISRFREEYKDEIELLEQGFTLYVGQTSNEDYDIASNWLCEQDIDFRTPDLVLMKEGGY